MQNSQEWRSTFKHVTQGLGFAAFHLVFDQQLK
jgi:hypothetical protein